ncbi:MAG: hypothetical protein KKC68_08415, partial [Candidatus Thermoplasmatota archaeon]|nr:hypothetical protein [Candidatus Thermoplasmatota archaeon]MBU1941783.1 hypothetical protein [Candidatus Thermoplasmatota archaeon]
MRELLLKKIFGISVIFLIVLSNGSFSVIGISFFSPILKSHNNNTYDLLIITPSLFAYHLKPLVQHKNKIGVKTILITLKDVYDKMYWYGRDEQEKIKYYIKTAYDEWNISYVLLVGGRKNHFT